MTNLPAAEPDGLAAPDGAVERTAPPSSVSCGALPAPPQLMRFWPLVGTIYFMVSGGPYGLEEIVASHGYWRSLALLLIVPILWSVPSVLLTGELTSCMPEDGGFYVWLRRGLGRFPAGLGAWLAFVASCCDMALYPTLFATYLGRLWPALGLGDTAPGHLGWWLCMGMIAASVAVNLLGVRRVGTSSLILGALMLSPFVLLILGALARVAAVGTGPALALLAGGGQHATAAAGGPGVWVDGVLLCMWNYSGWDNAAMIASEVESPRRTYFKALFCAMGLVTLSYVLTLLAAAPSGLAPAAFGPGSWVEVARRLCGRTVASLIVLGGAVSALGMFNALVMANARLPLVLAERGILPGVLARRHPRTGVPTLCTVGAALLYALCTGLGFQRLIEIDVVLYGIIVAMEFAALIALRHREPSLPRPFRIPLRLPGLVVLSVLPLCLLTQAVWARRHQPLLLGFTCGQLSALLLLFGVPVALWMTYREKRQEPSIAA